MLKSTIFILLLLLPLRAVSQLDLNDCIEYAEKSSLTLRQRQNQLRIYQQDKLRSQGEFLPSIGVESNAGYDFGRTLDPNTNTYEDNKYFSNNYYGSVQMLLFNGLKRVYDLKISSLKEKEGERMVQHTQDRLSLEVVEAYYRVLFLRKMHTYLINKQQESKHILSLIKRKHDLGLVPKSEYSQQLANVSADSYAFTLSENDIEQAMIQLKSIMNYPFYEELPLDTVLPALPQGCVASRYSCAQFNLQQLPEVMAAKLQVKIASTQLKGSLSTYFPTISLSAGYNSRYFQQLSSDVVADPFPIQWKNNANQHIGLRVSFPIFSQLQRITARRSKRFALAKQQDVYAEVERNAQEEVARRISDYEASYKELLQSYDNLSVAQEAHALNRRSFEKGLVGAIEFQQSANLLLQAQAEQVGALVQYYVNHRYIMYYQAYSKN